MKIAICDDSLNEAIRIKNLCSECKIIKEVPAVVYTDSKVLLEECKKSPAEYDLFLLDVEMPEMNGLELGKKLKELAPNAILVFITSFPQYAIEAFDCQAFHYLLKPCDKAKLFEIIEKATEKYKLLNRFYIIKSRNQTYRVPVNDIYYIECCRRHIIFHLKDRTIETVDSLSSVYGELCGLGFYQVHQGFIVNFEKVYDFKDRDIILDDGRAVMMSVRKKKEVLLAYAKYAEKVI